MARVKQSDWIKHDGSPDAPVPADALVGDCDMATDGVFRGRPMAAKSIYWRGVKRYKLVVA